MGRTTMTQQETAPDPGIKAQFSGSLVAAIELLQRGALVVDMHEFNMRLRKEGDDWGICSIPQHARQHHAQKELRDALANAYPVPPEHEEDTDAQPEAPAVGSAPTNA
jgi:hypothetical protein